MCRLYLNWSMATLAELCIPYPPCIQSYITVFTYILSPVWNTLPLLLLNDFSPAFCYQLKCQFHRELFLDSYPHRVCFCSKICNHHITLLAIVTNSQLYLDIMYMCFLRDDIKCILFLSPVLSIK